VGNDLGDLSEGHQISVTPVDKPSAQRILGSEESSFFGVPSLNQVHRWAVRGTFICSSISELNRAAAAERLSILD
jgi:hypothetical protein